ncbi:hypothetical protein BURKHO8Y_210586 [Burkholderia sp. 8Y]|nr:hypothetical protein BURKHO8Y_210586 [Burkholderia sp. 8Y]
MMRTGRGKSFEISELVRELNVKYEHRRGRRVKCNGFRRRASPDALSMFIQSASGGAFNG